MLPVCLPGTSHAARLELILCEAPQRCFMTPPKAAFELLGRFMNHPAPANSRYKPTCYEHAANCYTHAVSTLLLALGASAACPLGWAGGAQGFLAPVHSQFTCTASLLSLHKLRLYQSGNGRVIRCLVITNPSSESLGAPHAL